MMKSKEQQRDEIILAVKKAVNSNSSIICCGDYDYEQHFIAIDGNDIDRIAEELADEMLEKTQEVKPRVTHISDWGYQMIYKCGKCGYGFAMAHDGYDYCPHCGSKIDWGVMWEANEEWRHEYMCADDVKRELMKRQIDEYNQTIADGQKRVMEYTDATRRAVTKSNIDYYVSQGWSKEELIKKGFFTEKDFEGAGL